MATRFASVDDYIESFPPEERAALDEVRRTIHRTAPETDEKISYGMATVTLDGKPLVYYAGWKNHIGVYPVPSGAPAFEKAVSPYRRAKDTVRFPVTRPVPLDLIEQIVGLLLERRDEQSR